MAKPVTLKSLDAENGEIVINLVGPNGRDLQLRLSPFDVSTLVSGLYAQRAEALGQTPNDAPEVCLRMQGMSFGDDINHVLFRVHVSDHFHHDYGAEKGTPLADAIRALSDDLAKRLADAPAEFREPKKH